MEPILSRVGSQYLPPRFGEALIREDFANNGAIPHFETVLITGGTGVIGRWLLTYLDSANGLLSQSSTVYLVSRNHSRAQAIFADLKNINLQCLKVAEIETFITRNRPKFIWHLSADTGTSSSDSVMSVLDADLDMTLHIYRGVERALYAPNILYTSSGAVYGRPSAPMDARPNQTPISDLFPDSSMLYGHGKLLSESVLIALAKKAAARVNIARLFSFIGPLLPLDKHFAIGNFILDAHLRRPIQLRSRGESIRSWLYLGDLARYLLVLASRPDSNIVDIGGEESMTIVSAAHQIATLTGLEVDVSQVNEVDLDRSVYLPDLVSMKTICNLSGIKTFRQSVISTLDWLAIID